MLIVARNEKNASVFMQIFSFFLNNYKIFHALHSVLLHFEIPKKPDAACAETICITVPRRSSAAP
jgi:hypothetical protein